MARDVESLVLTMSADIRRLEKSLAQGQRTFDKTADAIERRQRQLDKSLANLGREAGNFARPVQLAATVALGAITALSYQAAKRAEAVDGAFKQTFRDMPQEAAKATAAIADEFGRLETDVKDNFTQLRSVLTALGVDAKQSLAIVDQLQRRSLDIAAFRDVSDADAFRAVISGITGETEPLKRFGIVVNETATKAELLRLGFKGNATQASEAAKSIARANVIMRQSAEMHGQVARESDTLAEQEKRTRAEFNKTAEDFGKQFLPIAAEVLKWATQCLKAFNDLPQGTQAAAVGLLALVAAGGPIASVISGLSKLIKAAVAARVAVAAVAGSAGAGAAAGAAGGAAGRAGAAGLLAGALPAVAAGGAAITSLGSFARNPANDPGWVPNRPGESIEAYNRRKAEVLQLRADTQKLLNEVGAGLGQAEADQAAQAALAGLGDFQLNDGQRAPAGGTGGGRAGRASNAAAIAARREELALERAIDFARASGDEATVRAAEERQALAQLTSQYEAAGYEDARSQAIEHLSLLNAATIAAEDRKKAEDEVDIILAGRRRQMEREADYQARIQDQLFDRLAMEAELARLVGHEGRLQSAERALWIEERINELLRLRPELTRADAEARAGQEWTALDGADREGRMRDEFRRSFSEGIRSALDGDLGGFFENLADRFTDRMLENLADDLFDLLAQAAKGFGGQGGESGGWLSAIGSTVAGMFGKRATGGGVVGGQPYITGERRAEVFVPHTSGTIIPSVQAAMGRVQGAQRAVSQSFTVKIDAKDAVLTEAVKGWVQQGMQQAVGQAVATSTSVARRSAPAFQQSQRRLGTP